MGTRARPTAPMSQKAPGGHRPFLLVRDGDTEGREMGSATAKVRAGRWALTRCQATCCLVPCCHLSRPPPHQVVWSLSLSVYPSRPERPGKGGDAVGCVSVSLASGTALGLQEDTELYAYTAHLPVCGMNGNRAPCCPPGCWGD